MYRFSVSSHVYKDPERCKQKKLDTSWNSRYPPTSNRVVKSEIGFNPKLGLIEMLWYLVLACEWNSPNVMPENPISLSQTSVSKQPKQIR